MELAPEIKAYLEEVGYAMVAAPLDLGSGEELVLLVKSTGDVLRALKAADAPALVGWVVRATPNGPVACLLLDVSVSDETGFSGECFFDPVDEEEFRLLGLLEGQEALRAAFYDEEMELVWLALPKWGEVERLAASQARDHADDLARRSVEEGCELDFDAALASFREEVGLERAARALREGRLMDIGPRP